MKTNCQTPNKTTRCVSIELDFLGKDSRLRILEVIDLVVCSPKNKIFSEIPFGRCPVLMIVRLDVRRNFRVTKEDSFYICHGCDRDF